MRVINNLIIKINSANIKKSNNFLILKSILILQILKFLYNQGIILGFFENKNEFIIFINNKSNSSSFSKIRCMKQKGLKLFFRYKDKKFLNNLKKDLVLLSTAKGLLSIEEAFQLKIGGEFLLLVIF